MGLTFYQTLLDLYERLGEYLSPRVDSAVALQSYLVMIGLVNVSNEPRAAAGLLAWSEDVRWNDGWRDAFVNSVGMYEELSDLQESADISLPTTAHLDRAQLELQARIHEAEDPLLTLLRKTCRRLFERRPLDFEIFLGIFTKANSRLGQYGKDNPGCGWTESSSTGCRRISMRYMSTT